MVAGLSIFQSEGTDLPNASHSKWNTLSVNISLILYKQNFRETALNNLLKQKKPLLGTKANRNLFPTPAEQFLLHAPCQTVTMEVAHQKTIMWVILALTNNQFIFFSYDESLLMARRLVCVANWRLTTKNKLFIYWTLAASPQLILNEAASPISDYWSQIKKKVISHYFPLVLCPPLSASLSLSAIPLWHF